MESAVKTVAGAAKKAVNAFATDAFTVSGGSGLYHRARPSYPSEAVEKLLSTLDNRSLRAGQEKSDAHVVEVGVGTGLFTECLVNANNAHPRFARLTAVEPSSGMRASFQKSKIIFPDTSTASAKVSIVDGSFAELPLADKSADIIAIAQAWHWAHPGYADAVAEFARVLRPGGTLAFIWNLEDRTTPWVANVRDAYEAYEQGTPQYRLGWWKETFNTAAYKDNFAPPGTYDFTVAHPTSDQGVVDRVFSKSYITAQPKEEQAKIEASIREILHKNRDSIRWIDEEGGTFEYPYATNLWLMKRNA